MTEPAAQFELETPPAPLLRWRQIAPFAPVVVACLAALVVYWPALNSPPFGDDYIYFRAARDLSWGDYARAAFVPHSQSNELLLSGQFWRPLYFLSFRALWPLFHANILPYHLLLLGIHFATIALTWLLARRLLHSDIAAGISALVVAVHPAGVDSVAWVSSLNSAALPLMLAAWLVFIAATETGTRRVDWRLVARSVALAALALGFRETAIAIVPIIAAWYLCGPARDRLRDWHAYLPLVPLLALAAAHSLVRTKFFTEPFADEFQYQWGRHMVTNTWELLRFGPAPFHAGGSAPRMLISWAAGLGVMATGGWALITRRWLLVSLFLAFGLSLAPFAPLAFGLDRRYFYFAAPFFALFLALAATEVAALLPRSVVENKPVLMPAAGALAAVFVLGTAMGNHRVHDWNERNAFPEQAWVDQLREVYPTLPAGGMLYCVDTPLVLALFGGYSVPPTVKFLYPHVGDARHIDRTDIERISKSLGPNDRIFIYKQR